MTQRGPEPGQPRDLETEGDEADEVIDLREHVLDTPERAPSGRPADLLPQHRLVTVTGGDRWVQLEAFVYDIYRKVGYCDESPRRRVEELARWNDASRFHAVFDDEDQVIGVVRTIFGRYADLPVGRFTRTDFRDPDPVCELSSLTVRNDVRSTGVIEHLYRAGWLDALRHGSRAVVALIDEWLLEVFVDTYHLPFSVIGLGREYMGGAPLPAGLPLVGHHYAAMASTNPDFWRWTLEAVAPEEVERWGLPRASGEDASAGAQSSDVSGSPERHPTSDGSDTAKGIGS